MKERLKEALLQAATETLEKLAFMFVFPEDEGDDAATGPMVGVSVAFTGPFEGQLFMTVSAGVLPEMAANMLGVDEEMETTSDQQYDALKETINVICGNLLPAIAGEEAVFNIRMPTILSGSDALDKPTGAEQGAEPVCQVTLSFEEGRCQLDLFVEGEILSDAVLS